MALQEIYFGTNGPYEIDDADELYAHPRQVATKADLASGLSVTVTLAKITVGGTNGSLTFVNGILTAKTDPT